MIICVITQLVFQQYDVLYLTVVNMTIIVEWWPQGFGKSTRCSWSEGFRAGPVGWWVLGFVHQMRNYLGGSPVGGWLYRIYIKKYIYMGLYWHIIYIYKNGIIPTYTNQYVWDEEIPMNESVCDDTRFWALLFGLVIWKPRSFETNCSKNVNFTIKDVDLTRKHGNIVGYTWIYNMNQDNMQVPANVFSKKTLWVYAQDESWPCLHLWTQMCGSVWCDTWIILL